MSVTPPKPPDPSSGSSIRTEDSRITDSGIIIRSRSSSFRKRTAANAFITENPPKKNASDSTQNNENNIWCHPSLNTPYKYTEEDKGPFLVHVHRTESNSNSGSTINRIQFGKMLMNQNVGKIAKAGIKNVGRNRVSVEFLSAQDANDFVVNPVLPTSKFIATIPTFNVTRMGVVRDIPTNWSMQEFVSQIDISNSVINILKARRFNRKVRNEDGSTEWVPSTTVVLSFSGQTLPTHIYCCYASIPVEPYLLPTIQCFTCCRFGHVKDKCRSKPRCFKCGDMHTGNTCSIPVEKAYCCLCMGNHFATDKNCAEFVRQKAIKKKMSEDNISYSEAATIFPSSYRSYADVSRAMYAPLPSHNSHPTRPNHSPASDSTQNRNTSYRRTFFSTPRTRSPLAPGYDRTAHQALISQYDPPSPHNGVALRGTQNDSAIPNNNLLEGLLTTLISIFSTFDDLPAPSNVAHKLTQLTNIINKIQPAAMEQS